MEVGCGRKGRWEGMETKGYNWGLKIGYGEGDGET
jgi:hypothetical protein